MINYSTVQSDQDLMGILKLQSENLSYLLTPEEKVQEGFVTVKHDLATLKRMHDLEPSVIALKNDTVVGYLLAMTSGSRFDISILDPMFKMFEEINFKSKPIANYNYLVVGQVCVDKNFRGTGLLDEMYDYYRDQFSNKYDFAITEIIDTNMRSIRAHSRIGFELVHQYPAPDETRWHIVIWDWVIPV